MIKDFFFGNSCFVWSDANSAGKTTLLRFILFSLGFQVPGTTMVRFKNYETKLVLADPDVQIERENNIAKLVILQSKKAMSFDLSTSDELYSFQSMLFGDVGIETVKNLLGCFYIDQHDGWRLFDKGKVIGKIFFDLRELIAGLSSTDISQINAKISKVEYQIQKYQAILNLMNVSGQSQEEKESKPNEAFESLSQKRAQIKTEINSLKRSISSLQSIDGKNKKFIDFIINTRIVIKHNGETFSLTKDCIDGFDDNELMISANIRSLVYKLKQKNDELCSIETQLDQYRGLAWTPDLASNVINEIAKIEDDRPHIQSAIKSLNKDKNDLLKEKEKVISSSLETIGYVNSQILRLGEALGVRNHMSSKGGELISASGQETGAISSKLSFCFRIACCLAVEHFKRINLPIIIDSPGTSEMKKDVVINLIKTARELLPDHQFIVSSVLPLDGEINFDSDIKISLGTFDYQPLLRSGQLQN